MARGLDRGASLSSPCSTAWARDSVSVGATPAKATSFLDLVCLPPIPSPPCSTSLPPHTALPALASHMHCLMFVAAVRLRAPEQSHLQNSQNVPRLCRKAAPLQKEALFGGYCISVTLRPDRPMYTQRQFWPHSPFWNGH